MGLFKFLRKGKVVETAAAEVAGGVVTSVIDSVGKLGESHLGRKELKLALDNNRVTLEKMIGDALAKKESAFRDFFLAYEGAAADQHAVIQVIRGLVRPILTIWFTFMFSRLLWGIMDVPADQLDMYVMALKLTFFACAIVLAFWFGDRSGFIKGMVESINTWAKHRPGNGGTK